MLLVFGFAEHHGLLAARGARGPTRFSSLRCSASRRFSIGLLGNLFSRLGSGCMPFLIPLLLQVSMGYSPLQAGLMMLPIALAGMAMKRFAAPLITRYGYRRVLVVNTVLVGLTMASFGADGARRSRSCCTSLQLLAFGAVNSLQFTAMNTITLQRSGRQHGEQRQQPAVDGADARDEPGRGGRERGAGGLHAASSAARRRWRRCTRSRRHSRAWG